MSDSPRIIRPGDGTSVDLGGFGARFMISREDTEGRFAMVEHPLEPRALGSPVHRHSREDEYSFVLEGRLGMELDGEVVTAEPGELIFKPRGQWHAFWNAGDESAWLLELISPAGFESYFAELAEVFAAGPPDPEKLAAVAAKYELEVQPDSIPRLAEEHGLHLPGAPAQGD